LITVQQECSAQVEMKTLVIMIVGLSMLCATAQEAKPATVSNATGKVLMRGIYPGRSQSARTDRGERKKWTTDCVAEALRAFKRTQNDDGSWGTPEFRQLATPLVLMAFLGRAETKESEEFGNVVAKAHEWTLQSSPTTHEERIVVLLGLAESVVVHTKAGNDAVAEREVVAIQRMVDAVTPMQGDPWTDLLRLHRLPAGIKRPEWLAYTPEEMRQWESVQVNYEPVNVDKYLSLRLVGLVRFMHGGETWNVFNKAFVPQMIERQDAAGFYPCVPDGARFACTALAVQSMVVYYAYQPQFWTGPAKPRAKATDADVKVEMK
jgi:hypothetical protein